MSDGGPGIHIPPPFFVLGGLGAAYLLDRQWPLPFLPAEWAGPSRVVSLVAFALCVTLLLWAMSRFLRARTPIIPNQRARKLVVWGPYRVTRNPMYTAMMLLYLAVLIRMDSLWAVLLFPVVFAIFNYGIIPREEQHLTETFGDEYRDYCGRVRRWL